MNIKYFTGVTTIEELKKTYRKLAKQYHPDKNINTDTTKIMIEINNEYEYLFKQLETTSDKKQGHKLDDSFRHIIDQLLKYESITIEVVGSWIWLSGNTYSVKDNIKEMGFKWSKSNKKWYYAEGIEGKKKRAISWDEKVIKYGSQLIQEGKKNNAKVLTA